MTQAQAAGGQAAARQQPPPQAAGLTDLVNRLAQELAEARRALATATQKLGTTSRTLEGRTQELTEAKAALESRGSSKLSPRCLQAKEYRIVCW